jgi:hypothetical protein
MSKTVAEIMDGLIETIRAGVPELQEVDALKGYLDPEKLPERLAKLPAAYLTVAGMTTEPNLYVNSPPLLKLTLVAFLIIPARKDAPEPLSLWHKVVDLVGNDAPYAERGARVKFDHAENLACTDAGRDWIYLYALRWSVVSEVTVSP